MVSKFFPIEFGHLCGVQQKWHLCDLRPRLVHPWVLEPAYNYSWEPTVHISSQLCVQRLKIGHSGSNDTMEISKYYKSGHFHPGRQLLNISQHTAASSPGSLVMLTLRSQPPRCEEPEHPVEKLMWRETKAPGPRLSPSSQLTAHTLLPAIWQNHLSVDPLALSHVTPVDTMWSKDKLQICARNCKFMDTY